MLLPALFAGAISQCYGLVPCLSQANDAAAWKLPTLGRSGQGAKENLFDYWRFVLASGHSDDGRLCARSDRIHHEEIPW